MEHRGTSPPAPTLIIGRDHELADVKERLLDGLTRNVKFSREAFRKALENSGLTKDELAKLVEVDRKTINNAENEHKLRDTNANAIAGVLKTTVRSLQQLPAMKTVVTLHASPGLGKTTVLQALCHQSDMGVAFSDGTLWAPLGRSPDIQGILTQWAFSLGVADPETVRKFGQQNVSGFLRAILNASLSAKRVLILLDDAWSTEHVRDLLVGGTGCPALVTTRQFSLASQVSGSSTTIALKKLSDEDSLELLRALAEAAVESNLPDAKELAVALEGHPLGLQVAARLIGARHGSGLDVAVLMKRLRDPGVLLSERVPDDGSPSRTVSAVFRISTDALTEAERKCFAFLSSWEAKPAPLDLEMMSASWSMFDVDSEQMAQVLVSRGLLEPLGGGKFWMHSLLTAHGRSLLRDMQRTE